jgi:5-methylcytosine-specific restriction endonuclease McrA
VSKHEWPDWEIYPRDKCRCVYCGLDGKTDFAIFRQLEIDHLVPNKGELFYNFLANRVVACHSCNALKGNFDPRESKDYEPNDRTRGYLVTRARQHIMERQQKLLDDYLQLLYEVENPD